jgi:hypothetical protein
VTAVEGYMPVEPNRGKWAGDSETCQRVQRIVNKINEKLLKQKDVKYSYVKLGHIEKKEELCW